eukprot:COSAG01_NODE_19704_length_994_cov_3.526257_2_plen_60_part_01
MQTVVLVADIAEWRSSVASRPFVPWLCLAVRELLLAARPKFTGIYVGNGLRFAEIRLSWL